MEKIDIMLWVIGAGFGIIFGLMLVMWNSIGEFRSEFKQEIKTLRDEVKEEFKELREELKDVKEDLKDIDRRLCRIEGAMASKDCCVLKDEKPLRKAE